MKISRQKKLEIPRTNLSIPQKEDLSVYYRIYNFIIICFPGSYSCGYIGNDRCQLIYVLWSLCILYTWALDVSVFAALSPSTCTCSDSSQLSQCQYYYWFVLVFWACPMQGHQERGSKWESLEHYSFLSETTKFIGSGQSIMVTI